jgi:hypothetical protein
LHGELLDSGISDAFELESEFIGLDDHADVVHALVMGALKSIGYA